MDFNSSIAIMYAVTPCHAGSGSALGVVDLPIQRERHTNYPVIQGSGVKGAFRANFDRYAASRLGKERTEIEELTRNIFGTENGAGYAGSSSFGDARILAYPMRSNVSPFVWITCPSVLKRFKKDLEAAGKDVSSVKIPEIDNAEASYVINGNLKGKVLVEDYEVNVTDGKKVEGLGEYLLKEVMERLILVSDDVFNYGVTDCTQIMAQIKIDPETGTTATGSLRYQEELPSDTVMYSVIHWGDSKGKDELKAEVIKDFIINKVISKHIQIAGDETCGRGIFELLWK